MRRACFLTMMCAALSVRLIADAQERRRGRSLSGS
jgi:hypothetical protein